MNQFFAVEEFITDETKKFFLAFKIFLVYSEKYNDAFLAPSYLIPKHSKVKFKKDDNLRRDQNHEFTC